MLVLSFFDGSDIEKRLIDAWKISAIIIIIDFTPTRYIRAFESV